MDKLIGVYNNSPLLIQHLLTTGSGLLKARERYGRIYSEHRQWLQEYDTWSLDAKLSHHSSSLQKFLAFVLENSSYYKNLYNANGLGIESLGHDLSRLPTVDKEMLRKNIDAVYTVPQKGSVISQTGGTTGKPLSVRYTREDFMRRMAMLDHFKSRHGFENRKMWKATFSGKPIIPQRQKKPIYWRYNRASKQILYSTFHLSRAALPHYVRHLNKMRPLALDGFVTSLTDVAKFIDSHGLSLEFKPLGIFPTAETLTTNDRELLERVFQCKVFNQYASSEGAPFVTECAHGALHIELSTGVFETLPGTDEILVTSFTTHGTPLVRYQIGDSMKLDWDSECSCGMSGPLVESIQGRVRDYLERTDGAKVLSAQVANMFKVLPPGVIRAQVVQEKIGHIDILVQADRQAVPSEITSLLEREVLNAFGPETTADIEFVENIPRAASGKHQLVRNLL